MAATDDRAGTRRRAWGRACGWLRRLASGLLRGAALTAPAVAPAVGAVLPDDQAEVMLHTYSGGGVTATGPALLVRRQFAGKVSLSGLYYVDAVSNASIDVVTTASPYRETRRAGELTLTSVIQDATVTLGLSASREPDYVARAVSLDLAQDVFGGMSTVNLGFTRGADDVGARGRGFFDRAHHWQYRLGLSQVLSPRWTATLNGEVVSDDGFLGSPYRVARVFGAAVPERVPRTRTSRAVLLRANGSLDGGRTVRAEWRHGWDNWGIRSDTVEVGGTQRFGTAWLLDTQLRWYRQGKAVFYSDNAAVETLYVSRNRLLGTGDNLGLGSRLTYSLPKGWAGSLEPRISGFVELKRFAFADYTDLRTGQPYRHTAALVQLVLSGTY